MGSGRAECDVFQRPLTKVRRVLVAKTVLDQFKLEGRKALITGGAKGLGKVIATALAQAGADVAISSRTLSECQAAAQEIAQATGRKTYAVAADVSKIDEVAG